MLSRSALQKFRSNRGQVLVEYMLLLAVAVTLAMILISNLVRRSSPDNPENSGALIKKWRDVQDSVAKDVQN